MGPAFLGRPLRRAFVGWVERSEEPGSIEPLRRCMMGFALLNPSYKEKIEGGGTPANAGTFRRTLRRGARSFERVRLTAFHRGSRLRELLPSQRLSFRPGFLGRGLHGRYPPSPVPVQGKHLPPRSVTPGDMMPSRPGSGLQIAPAGTALAATTRCAPRHVLQRSEDYEVSSMRRLLSRDSRVG